MGWVQSDRIKDVISEQTQWQQAVSMLRGAFIDELGATDLYDKLAVLIPQYAGILREIRDDEINHQGRLLDLIMKLDGSQMEAFNAGLDQEEVKK